MPAELRAKIIEMDALRKFNPRINIELLSAAAADAHGSELVILPGFCDVHVHFREPGFSYKETIYTGTLSAAKGGYTDVCTMPNVNPVPDSLTTLNMQLGAIRKNAVINVHPYGSITKGENGKVLSDIKEMADDVVAFSDDGHGVTDYELLEAAMYKTKEAGKVLASHCEDLTLTNGGCIHDGAFAKAHGYKGICSESEWKPIQKELEIAGKTGCKYHVCHISCKESVELIRNAKAKGIDVTCETAPHYLLLDENDLEEDGRFKMNPPIRTAADRQALIEGLRDGTIDMIATDHAPHSKEEKSKGLAGSAFGVVGLETAFQSLYTGLVRTKIITLEKLVELMAINPRKRFGIELGTGYTVWNLEDAERIEPEKFRTKGRATPFEGKIFYGKCLLTCTDDTAAYLCNN